MPWKKKWEYAVYKGDECLAIGTRDEICKQLNISYKTFQFYRSNYYRKNKYDKSKYRRRVIERIMDDGEI